MIKNQNPTTRPPIVVVLGHIDHGKTSLLLAIRNFQFTGEKPGGEITQHIGAYQVEKDGKKITFLDTPGHEAFSQMRSRGAKVADIAILVIDAAQGVQAQTKEAISEIKQTGIQVIVALNKMDKPEANPAKVKGELQKGGILVESLGGKIPSIEISAKTNKGIQELLELILLVAEMEGLKTETDKPGEGVVIESYQDNLRGPTATLLLTQGILKVGDIVATPSALTKIKSLENFQKKPIERAFASDPVIVFGFNQVPKVGEEFKVFPDLASAEKYAQTSKKIERTPEVLEISEGQKVLNLVLKTDVLGSAEAIEEILKSLPQEKIVLRILKSEVGNINESDVKLAASSRALIFGFRVKTDSLAKKIAEREKAKIMTFEIIYDLVEEVRKFMEKILSPEQVRRELGKVKVLVKFISDKNRQIVGGRVVEGEVKKGASIEVWRSEEKVGQGRMINLQRNKKDADLVSKGDECGILFEGNVKIEEGDMLLIFVEERIKGEL
ncbi:MAG: translation initiation factor IF-2 [Candidatus Pacebacteria bacterium]|nr:translation initiation factor IF-2 [Candidatus Paceibacterota bacterium]